MRVKIDNSWIIEVESVRLGVTDDGMGTMIVFKSLMDSKYEDPYIECEFPMGTLFEDAKRKFEVLSKDLLEKGYADFSELNLDII